jgi:hypothetical protein
MQLIADEIDGAIYVDIVLSPPELTRIKRSEVVSGELILRRRKYYIGIRLRGLWDYDEAEDREDLETTGSD